MEAWKKEQALELIVDGGMEKKEQALELIVDGGMMENKSRHWS